MIESTRPTNGQRDVYRPRPYRETHLRIVIAALYRAQNDPEEDRPAWAVARQALRVFEPDKTPDGNGDWLPEISYATGLSHGDAWNSFGGVITDDHGNEPGYADIAGHLEMLLDDPGERDTDSTPCIGEAED